MRFKQRCAIRLRPTTSELVKSGNVATMKASGHNRWTYLPPIIHLSVCLLMMSRYVVPKLEFLGILATFIMVADFPVSLAVLALAWKHPEIAAAWILIVGTLWWFVLSRAIEFVIRILKPLRGGDLDKLNYG